MTADELLNRIRGVQWDELRVLYQDIDAFLSGFPPGSDSEPAASVRGLQDSLCYLEVDRARAFGALIAFVTSPSPAE